MVLVLSRSGYVHHLRYFCDNDRELWRLVVYLLDETVQTRFPRGIRDAIPLGGSGWGWRRGAPRDLAQLPVQRE